MKKKIFICGEAGTTGLELKTRLDIRDDVELLRIDDEKRKDNTEIRRLMGESDVTFLCLPDDAAREIASLAGEDVCLIDSSTAHRVAPGWTYGFPERSEEQRRALQSAKRIANPGCHATGFISIVAPLVQSGALPADAKVTSYSITGYSGGGKKMIEEYEADARDEGLISPRHYALSLDHKHVPEMKKYAGLLNTPLFEPIVCDFYRGMAVTVPLFREELRGVRGPADVLELLQEHYRGKIFVSAEGAPPGGSIGATELAGSNRLKLYVSGNGGMISVTSVFDNLGKGAAGAAVQNMNLALGFEENKFLE